MRTRANKKETKKISAKKDKSQLAFPVDEIHGAVEKKGVIHRKKKYRDANGKIVGEGTQELYKVVNPRDFRRHPQTPAEQAHHERFRVASNRAIAIIHAADDSTPHSPELMEELSIWQARFNAQLVSTRNSQPDPEAPVDPATGRGKRYLRLDTFIRAILYRQLKSQA